jgi:hypothetical protein
MEDSIDLKCLLIQFEGGTLALHIDELGHQDRGFRHRRREDNYDHGNHHGLHATLAGAAATGVVMAAAFCEICLPRKPATTTPIKTATRTTAATRIATRLPRPILVFLTISLISRSLAMRRSRCIDHAAATGPTRRRATRATKANPNDYAEALPRYPQQPQEPSFGLPPWFAKSSSAA